MPACVMFASAGSGPAEEGGPRADRALAGSPRFRTWNAYEGSDGKTFCGIWESTPGAWKIAYDEWESCTILSGVSIVTPDGGEPIRLTAGDSIVIEPGFRGVWEVVETTRKSYVIRL